MTQDPGGVPWRVGSAVKLKVAWCGICGTDLHEYLEGPIFIPSPGRPHPLSHEEPPVTMGHEFSGTVEAIGEGVTDIALGDNVVVEPYFVCDECPPCKAGNYNLCTKMGFIGLAGGGGGLSEKVVVERRWVHKIGDIPLDEAAPPAQHALDQRSSTSSALHFQDTPQMVESMSKMKGAHRVERADMAECEAAQEGAQGGRRQHRVAQNRLGRSRLEHVGGVDAVPTCQHGVDEGHRLVADVGLAQVHVVLHHLPQLKVLAQSGRQQETGAGHSVEVVEGDSEAVQSVRPGRQGKGAQRWDNWWC